MAGCVFILSVWICFCLMIPGRCEDNLQPFLDRLNTLEEDYHDLKIDLVSSERKLTKRIFSAKNSLRSEIKKQINDALSDTLRSESIDAMIKSQVISETRHLKLVNHQMRRELDQMKKILGHAQEDNMMNRESIQNDERKEKVTCSKCLESNMITNKFTKFDDKITELTTKVTHLETLQHVQTDDPLNTSREPFASPGTMNASTSSSSLSTTGAAPATTSTPSPTTPSTATTTPSPTTPTTPSTATPSTLSTTSSTTLSTASTTSSTTIIISTLTTAESTTAQTPRNERNRILVTPYNSGRYHSQQINIKSQVVTDYSSLKLNYVNDVVYVWKLNSLLIAQAEPKRILSSRLDSSTTEILRDRIGVYTIAVDEGRDLMFLGSLYPVKHIYRMDLNGKHLTIFFNTSGSPESVVVNPNTRTIYIYTYYKLISSSYDGNNVVTLDTGSLSAAATIDISKGYLYYVKYIELYRHSISQNTTSKVATLSFNPYSMSYYRDTIYYSGRSRSVGAFNLVNRSGTYSYRLDSIRSYHNNRICLLP